MSRPGDRLRAFAFLICNDATMARVIDPAIADLQAERGALSAYLAVLKVIVLCALGGAVGTIQSWPVDDRRNAWRTVGMSSIALVLVTLALTVPAYFSVGAYRQSVPLVPALLRLLPQALAISVSISLMLGLSFSLGGRVASGRVKAAVVAIAVVCSMATFLNIGWLTPAANQSFRLLYAARLGISPAPVRTGLPELSLGELRHKVQSAEAIGVSVSDLDLELTYYARWVISFAPVVLAVFMLSIITRRVVRTWALALIAVVTLFGHYVVMYFARTLAFAGDLPASLAIWMPNILLAVLAGALLLLSSRRPAEAGRYWR
jgi:hypothetical protein